MLDVGCGTGRLAAFLAARGAKVWGVEASTEMLAAARRTAGARVGLKQGRAEALPFRDGWFERAVLRLVVHLVDRPSALAELRRVLQPGGRAVVATFRPEHFDEIWLAPYFPSVARIDRERFPEPSALVEELGHAGFERVQVRHLSQRASVSRDDMLERLHGRYISTLRLIPEEEYRAGLARAERELAPAVEYGLEWAIVVATSSESGSATG